MRPTKAAESVIAGLRWPPETGPVARRRIVTRRATEQEIIMFGVLVSVSKEEMTRVSIMNTKSPVPKSSANDARQT